MAERSPTAEGFRTIVRTPSLWLAEVAWRWGCGVSAGLLLFLALCELLASVSVSNADILFLHPALRLAAISSLLHGSVPGLLRMAAVLLPALAALWVVASALGRAATLNVMLSAPVRLRTLVGLSFLRAAVTVAALLSLVSTTMVPRIVHSGVGGAVAFATAVATILLWMVLNWLLTMASVRAGEGDTLSAIASAVRLLRKNFGAFAATGAWFGLMHLSAAAWAYVAVLLALATAGISVKLALALCLVVIAAYCALADFFYIARLAAYVVIAEDGATPSGPVPVPEETVPSIPPALPLPETTA